METTDRMLEKVRKIIAKADGTDNTEEREAFLQKASALMLQHSIDEAMLEATRPEEKRTQPEALEFIDIATGGTPVKDALVDLSAAIAEHFGCKIVFFGLQNGKARDSVYGTVVGFPSGLQSFQTLFTALQLELARQINPKASADRSFDENVYILRSAGVKWGEIAFQLNRIYLAMSDEERAAQGWKLIPLRNDAQYPIPAAAYRRYCKKIGEAPRRTQSPVNYQRNFATGFVSQISMRMIMMRIEAQEATEGSGTALVLRADAIDDKLNDMFPKVKEMGKRQELRYNSEARRAGRAAGDRADLGQRRTGSGSRPELDG